MILLKNTTNNQIFYIIHKKMYGDNTGWDLKPLVLEYTENGQYSIVPPSGYDGFSSVNVTVDVECSECNLTTSTVTLTGDGEHTITPPEGYDGFSEVVVNVESDCEDAYEEGVADQKAKLASATFTENGSYNSYDGYSYVNVNVDTITPYNNGKLDGIAEQKAKLISGTFTQNGTFNREDGYNQVIVNVPSDVNNQNKTVDPSTSQQIITPSQGYSGLGQVTVNAVTAAIDPDIRPENIKKDVNVLGVVGTYDPQPDLEAKTATYTTNGTYSVVPSAGKDGLSGVEVTVNVDTQTPYDNGYADGEADQKAKLTTLTVTQNGTYTRADGYDEVVVNVQCGGTDELLLSRETIEVVSDGDFPEGGIEYPIGVYSTDDWTITSKPDWVSTDSDSGNAGVSLLNVTVNSLEDGRTGTITITNGTITKTITITQLDYSAKYLTLEVTSPGTLYWKQYGSQYSRVLQFSTSGTNWTSVTSVTTNDGCLVGSFSAGTKIMFKSYTDDPVSSVNYHYFVFKNGLKGNISGNIKSFPKPYDLFKGCTGIQSAEHLIVPEGTDCSSLFVGCTGLTTAPKSLPRGRYQGMFAGCTKLTTAPALPSTTLSRNCYQTMFSGCSSLTTTPALPATVLTESCYEGMFNGCTNLINAPELPATTLAKRCYYTMFQNCSNLITAPALPATTLAEGCYMNMFYGCTSLATAPELPALELVDYCYHSMFLECNNLNYIKAMFITTPEGIYTNRWLENTSTTGTFVKNAAATWTDTGTSAVPTGWTVETASA